VPTACSSPEIGGDAVDLLALFELHGRSLYDTARRLLREKGKL